MYAQQYIVNNPNSFSGHPFQRKPVTVEELKNVLEITLNMELHGAGHISVRGHEM